MTQTKAIYSPMDPKAMFAEILAEANRQSQLTEEQMNGCVGAQQYHMSSWFAGHVAAMRMIADRYQTSVAAVDLTNEVRDKLKDIVLGRAFYNQAMGRLLTVIESILALTGIDKPEIRDAAKRLVQGAINAVQESMRAEWDTQWWELIKLQVQDIPIMTTLEAAEGLGPKDRDEVFNQVFQRLQERFIAVGRMPSDRDQFSRLVAQTVIDGLEACHLVEERLPVPSTDTGKIG